METRSGTRWRPGLRLTLTLALAQSLTLPLTLTLTLTLLPLTRWRSQRGSSRSGGSSGASGGAANPNPNPHPNPNPNPNPNQVGPRRARHAVVPAQGLTLTLTLTPYPNPYPNPNPNPNSNPNPNPNPNPNRNLNQVPAQGWRARCGTRRGRIEQVIRYIASPFTFAGCHGWRAGWHQKASLSLLVRVRRDLIPVLCTSLCLRSLCPGVYSFSFSVLVGYRERINECISCVNTVGLPPFIHRSQERGDRQVTQRPHTDVTYYTTRACFFTFHSRDSRS